MKDTLRLEICGEYYNVPSHFVCPITQDIMSHPLVTCWGLNFERSAIFGWLQKGSGTCPLSRRPLRPGDLVSNYKLQREIEAWKAVNAIPINEDCEELAHLLAVSGPRIEKHMKRRAVERLNPSVTVSISQILAVRRTNTNGGSTDRRATTSRRLFSRTRRAGDLP